MPPSSVYKGGEEESAGQGGWRALGGVNLLQVGLPLPFLVLIGLLPKGGGRTNPLWAGVLPSYGT